MIEALVKQAAAALPTTIVVKRPGPEAIRARIQARGGGGGSKDKRFEGPHSKPIDIKRTPPARAKGTRSGLFDPKLHPRSGTGQFSQTNTPQSRQRDREVAAANRAGDPGKAFQAQRKYEAKWRHFLQSLPMAHGAKDLKAVAKLVRTARTKNDDELRRMAAQTNDEGTRKTLELLLRNREKFRAENLKKHPLPRKRKPAQTRQTRAPQAHAAVPR